MPKNVVGIKLTLPLTVTVATNQKTTFTSLPNATEYKTYGTTTNQYTTD